MGTTDLQRAQLLGSINIEPYTWNDPNEEYRYIIQYRVGGKHGKPQEISTDAHKSLHPAYVLRKLIFRIQMENFNKSQGFFNRKLEILAFYREHSCQGGRITSWLCFDLEQRPGTYIWDIQPEAKIYNKL